MTEIESIAELKAKRAEARELLNEVSGTVSPTTEVDWHFYRFKTWLEISYVLLLAELKDWRDRWGDIIVPVECENEIDAIIKEHEGSGA